MDWAPARAVAAAGQEVEVAGAGEAGAGEAGAGEAAAAAAAAAEPAAAAGDADDGAAIVVRRSTRMTKRKLAPNERPLDILQDTSA